MHGFDQRQYWHQLFPCYSHFPTWPQGCAQSLPSAQHGRKRTRTVSRLGLVRVFTLQGCQLLSKLDFPRPCLKIPGLRQLLSQALSEHPLDTGDPSSCFTHLDSVLPEKAEPGRGQLPKSPQNHGCSTHQTEQFLSCRHFTQ